MEENKICAYCALPINDPKKSAEVLGKVYHDDHLFKALKAEKENKNKKVVYA